MAEFFHGGRDFPEAPTLFCDSTFLVDQVKSDQARDNTGALITINNVPQTIGMLYGKVIKKNYIPSWSEYAKAYQFGPVEQGRAYCSASDQKGGTGEVGYTKDGSVDRHDKWVVTICPHAFTSSEELDTLPSDAASMRTNQGNAIATGDTLNTVMPKSATLMHEAFHFVIGGSAMNSNGGEEICKFISLQMPGLDS